MKLSKGVESTVSDPRLIEERRTQILRAAIKLFSKKGYYRTTILDIAKEAGISSGLIYQYFREKEDVLYLALMLVLETYEHEVPPKEEDFNNPVQALCASIRAYCMVVDRMRDATVLAYRSTKSLPPDRRVFIKDGEARTNRIIRKCVSDCIQGGYMREVNKDLLVYQYVLFCHAWALKYWAFKEKYSVERYIEEGIQLLVVSFLTPRGQRALKTSRENT